MSEELKKAEENISIFLRAWNVLKPVQREVKEAELQTVAAHGMESHPRLGLYSELARRLGIGREAVRQRRIRGDIRLRRFFRTGH